jgi:hypothetical protein
MPVECPGRGHRANSQSRSLPETGSRHHTSVRNPRPTLFGRASNRAPMSARAVAVIRPAANIIAQLAFLYILSGPGQLHASGDLSEEQRAIWGASGLSIQQLSHKSGLLVIFTPMSELRDFIVRRLPKQNRQIEEGHGSVLFAVAANGLAGYPRVSRNFPGARPASFLGNRSYIPLACDDTFPWR